MALYMGPSSSFGFSNSPLQGGQPPRVQGQPVQNMPSPVASQTLPTGPAPVPTAPTLGKNVLGAGAVRATGPSKGYDPAYLQNLATSIGGLFSNSQQGGNVMRINPLGDLKEISPGSGIGGTDPTQGIPLTWLQQALNGGGFSFGQPETPNTPAKPKTPVIAGSGGGGRTGSGRLKSEL